MIGANRKIIAFMNAYSQGKSGSDMVFIEVFKRFEELPKFIITSFLGKKLCQENGLKGTFLVTSNEKKFTRVILIYLARTLRALSLKIKVNNLDILLGTSDFLPDVLPIFLLKFKNKKAIWVQHIFHLIPSSRKISYWSQQMSFFLIKKWANLVVVDNKLLRKDLIKKGFSPNKIKVNYLGLDINYLKSVKIKTGKKYEGIFMAQLRPSKGIFDLLKIWRLVCQKKSKAKLAIVGKGEEKIIKKISLEIQKLGLGKNVDFLGYLKNDEAYKLIKASKIFLFPSYEEGFGLAALEAQALGLPVVAWNLPVFKEVFEKGIIKVKTGDVNRFSKEALNLLDNDSLFQTLTNEARKNAAKFDWKETALKELKLIQAFD